MPTQEAIIQQIQTTNGNWEAEWHNAYFHSNDVLTFVLSLHELLKIEYVELFGSLEGLYPEVDGWWLHPMAYYMKRRYASEGWPPGCDPDHAFDTLDCWVNELAGLSVVDDRITKRAWSWHVNFLVDSAFKTTMDTVSTRITATQNELDTLRSEKFGLPRGRRFYSMELAEREEAERQLANIDERLQRTKKQRNVLNIQKYWLDIWHEMYDSWRKKVRIERVTLKSGVHRAIRNEDIYDRNEELQQYLETLSEHYLEEYQKELSIEEEDPTWVLLANWYVAMLAKIDADPRTLGDVCGLVCPKKLKARSVVSIVKKRYMTYVSS